MLQAAFRAVTNRSRAVASRLGFPCLSQQQRLLSAEAAAVGKLSEDEVVRALQQADAVCFDVDSTVITTEGIDQLGAFLGKAKEIEELTTAAMEGDMPFQDALGARLKLLEPSRRQIEDLLQQHPHELTPAMREITDLLRSLGKQVFLVSGGFENMIAPVAEVLDVPMENVFANRILFHDDDEGTYKGFDDSAFTSRAGGKARAILHIKEANDYRNGVVMVGDGGTDYEARRDGAADVFVGYGHIANRKVVRENADLFIMHWDELASRLQWLIVTENRMGTEKPQHGVSMSMLV